MRIIINDILGRITYSYIVQSCTNLNMSYACFLLKLYQSIVQNSRMVDS